MRRLFGETMALPSLPCKGRVASEASRVGCTGERSEPVWTQATRTERAATLSPAPDRLRFASAVDLPLRGRYGDGVICCMVGFLDQ